MLVSLIVLLVVVGIVLYLIQLLPIDATFKQIIRIVIVLAALLYVLQMAGLLRGLG